MSDGWRITRRTAWWIAGIAVFLLSLRLALPFAVEDYVNHQLRRSHDYSGSIGRVTIHLWRGAYEIHDINVFKTTDKISVPFFSSQLLDLSLQWSELFHGAFVSKIIMEGPRLNFVSGPAEAQSQTGTENNWGETLESLVPFKINRLDIIEGRIHFLNPYSKPPVDIYITNITALATNFANSQRMAGDLPAGITAKGMTLGGGGLSLSIHVNPLAKTPTFELTGQLTNVDLVALNDFLRAYGKFDVGRGTFDLFSSFATTNETYDGYCKVFFRDLKVFNWEQDKKKDVLEIFWKAIVGTLTAAFKNQPHDQLATKIPISGSFGKTDVHIWPTIATLLRNAFIRALVPKLDEPVQVTTVDGGKPPPPSVRPQQPAYGTAKR
jgi:hypothetical protein